MERMALRQDLRGFLKAYEQTFPNDVLHLDREIDCCFETTAMLVELEKQHRHPLVFFENVRGSEFPAVANILSSRQKMSMALGTEVQALPYEYARRIKNPIPPVVNDQAAPFTANIVSGKSLDLKKLPIFTHFPLDAGPYITGGLVAARDPVTGIDTCGYHRLQLKGQDKMGISLHSRKRLWEFFRRAEELGKNLEAAVVIGVHPAFSLGAMAIVPLTHSKYAIIGGLFEEAAQLAKCPTIDVEVPFWSEIVIEGEILAGARETEGPFAEFTNYACHRSTENIFKAKTICFRNNPLYQSITSGMSAEHNLIMAVQREGDLLKALHEGLLNIQAVNVPLSGCGFFHCYISLKKTAEGQPLQAILKALSIDHNLKLVVVVDEDVDVFNEQEVLWALATRMQADKDVLITPQHLGMGCTLDPSSDDLSRSSKMGIDATRPMNGFPDKVKIDPELQAKMRAVLAEIRGNHE
jgi:UbiD family decarboxylase